MNETQPASSTVAPVAQSAESPPTAGDPLPRDCELIEVRVAELRQLFNQMDASPFRERDLDPDAEEFIVGWAREVPRATRFALLVELNRAPGLEDEPAVLREVLRGFFARRALGSKVKMKQLLSFGRRSLVLGLCFLIAAVSLGGLVATALRGRHVGELIQQGLTICGWVAMWRPLEIFLYDWWPIRNETRLYELLSHMLVRIAYVGTAEPEAWRHDWPARPRHNPIPQKTPPKASSPI